PLNVDGSRSPKVKWKDKETGNQVAFPWWKLQHYFCPGNPSGIGIICGSTSGNLEVIDFDDASLFVLFCDHINFRCKGLLASLPQVKTPGGYHIYYRCPEIVGNLVLAQDKEGEILLETRGQGGM